MASFGGTAICKAVMATYFYLEKSTDVDVTPYNWLPVVSFSAMIFIIAFGALPIPYVILSEILPYSVSLLESFSLKLHFFPN